jgi:hypothetical protein
MIKLVSETLNEFESSEERAEKIFGPSTNLEKQYSDIALNNLGSDDNEIAEKWATYEAVMIELKKQNKKDLVKEVEYNITDGKNANKVFLDAMKGADKTTELKRLEEKIKNWE